MVTAKKNSFFSRIDSCFKNQIDFLLLILPADSCVHEYKSVNYTDEQIDKNYHDNCLDSRNFLMI